MAKRKRRNNSPDLPEATLARARAQARGDAPEPEEVPETAEAEPSEPAPASKKASTPERTERSERRARRRSTPQPVQAAQPRRRNDTDKDAGVIVQKLANPTIFVTEEQLRQEYGFVVTDIRNMFMLTAVLIVLLVILVQFI